MLIIKIKDTGNSAFTDENYHEEIARILRNLADKIENGNSPTRLLDSNGNSIGTFEVTGSDKKQF